MGNYLKYTNRKSRVIFFFWKIELQKLKKDNQNPNSVLQNFVKQKIKTSLE